MALESVRKQNAMASKDQIFLENLLYNFKISLRTPRIIFQIFLEPRPHER